VDNSAQKARQERDTGAVALGDLILKYRSLRNQTQAQFGDRADLAASTVGRIEAGQRPRQRPVTAVALARAMLNGYPPMSGDDAEKLRVQLNIPEPIWTGLLHEMVPADRPAMLRNAAPISEAMALVGELIGLVGPDQSLAMIRGMVSSIRAIMPAPSPALLAQNAHAAHKATLDVHLPPKPRPDLGPGIVEQEIRTYGVPAPGGKRQPGQRRKQG
jgi:transcriptional regulator with XRE-family HTH domain